MLGKAPISSVGISGGAFKLVGTLLTMSASGPLLAFSGSVDGAFHLIMRASGPLLSFSGSAPGVWTQALAASGSLLNFRGDPLLLLAGKPWKIAMVADSYQVREIPKNYKVNMVAGRFVVRRER